MVKEEVNVSLKDSKIRIREKTNSKGKVRKLKLHIDLDKNESESFKNVVLSIKPENVDTDSFVKSLFLLGLGSYIERLEQAKKEFDAKNLSTSGTLAPLELTRNDVSSIPNVEIIKEL